MSRIGRKPIPTVKGVKIERKDGLLKVVGPKGELTARMPEAVSMDVKDNDIHVTRASDLKAHRALHGTWRALLNNMIKGVSEGFVKKLEIVGVGYRAELKGRSAEWQPIRNALKKGRVTLLFAAKDEAHNNAVALKRIIEAHSRSAAA